MPLEFYKANPRSTGAACQFSFNSKERALFVSIKRQVSYNPQKRIGSFWDGERCLVKFSVNEIGQMCHALERNKEWSNYHGFGGNKTQIFFKPYIKEDNEGNPVQKGFTLNIARSVGEEEKKSFLIGFDFGECVVIREFLKFALEHIFSAIYSADKKSAEERNGNHAETPPKKADPKVIKNTSKARKGSAASEYLGDPDESVEDPFAVTEKPTNRLEEVAAPTAPVTPLDDELF
jgi:hypothetical protein